tara:strand:- start:7537 stop:9012 length:1476 start_codon:yes stop_codon:yes gene_type:complete
MPEHGNDRAARTGANTADALQKDTQTGEAYLTDQQQFLNAIRESPDDLSRYTNFAAWLEKSGDPRGAFMNVQLRRIDKSLSPAESEELEEQKFLEFIEHLRDGQDGLTVLLLEGDDPDFDAFQTPSGFRVTGNGCTVDWRRGFIDTLEVELLTPRIAYILKHLPHVGMLRHLIVNGVPDREDFEELNDLTKFDAGHKWNGDANAIFAMLQGVEFENLRHFAVEDVTVSDTYTDSPPLRIMYPHDMYRSEQADVDPDDVDPDDIFPDDLEPDEIDPETGLAIPTAPDGCPPSRMRAENLSGLIKHMPRLESLILFTENLNHTDIFRLKMPHLKCLTAKTEVESRLGEFPIRILASNSSLTHLDSVSLFASDEDRWDEEPGWQEEIPSIHLDDLKAICRSQYLGSLANLSLYDSDFGDNGIVELIESGRLRQLKSLNLTYGEITDDGAELLATTDLSSLESLILDQNRITKSGVKALQKTGVNLSAKWQRIDV